MHDVANPIRTIFGQIQTNLYESGLKWYSEEAILASIQDVYNKLVSILQPIERSTLIPQQDSPYYSLANQISDYMFLSGIYNPTTNRWLRGIPVKTYKSRYESFRNIGQPTYFNVMDFRRILIWPFSSTPPSGTLLVVYKAMAPLISMDHIPLLPYSVSDKLLECGATADLLEQAREFNKAMVWMNKIYAPQKRGKKSIFQQAKDEIKALARMDRELVLEPYRWIFHGGTFNVSQVNNETPTGTINGVNATFTLAGVPNPTSSLILTKNGQILYNTLGYNLSGQTIVFETDYIPQAGDALRAWYTVG